MIQQTLTRIILSLLAAIQLTPALLTGVSHALPSPVAAAAESRCADTGTDLFIRWTQADLPGSYFMLTPDPSWSTAIVGFFGIPILYPPDWSYQEMPDGAGAFLGANDGSAAFAVQALTDVQAGITSEEAALTITSWLLNGADGSVLCATSGMMQGDLPTQYTILSAQRGDSIALAYVMVLPNPNTGQAMVTYYAMGGPASQFADLMVGVFLPMMNMYIRTHGAF